MCERYELKATARDLMRHWPQLQLARQDMPDAEEIFPMDPVLIVTGGADGYAGSNARWGLVGNFLDDAPHHPILDLRCEGLEARPFYGKILRRNRCLIPATAFFEWQAAAGGDKRKYRIACARNEPMMFAGVFDHHRHAGATCAMLTVPANAAVAGVRPRMPLMLGREAGLFWLADHADFPSEAFATAIEASSHRELKVEALAEPEVSPQLAFDFA